MNNWKGYLVLPDGENNIIQNNIARNLFYFIFLLNRLINSIHFYLEVILVKSKFLYEYIFF